MPDEPSRRLYPALYPNFDRQFDREAKAPPPTPDLDVDDRPLWRRVAAGVGVDDEIDAATGAWHATGDWLRSSLGLDTPEARAAQAALDRRLTGPAQAGPGPVARLASSGPVQAVVDSYRHLWTPTREATYMADMARTALDQRKAEQAPALATLPWPVRAAVETVDDAIPRFLVDTAEGSSHPIGALSNLDLPLGAVAKAGAAGMAGALPAELVAAVRQLFPKLDKWSKPAGFVSRATMLKRIEGAADLTPAAKAELLQLADQIGERRVAPAELQALAAGETYTPDRVLRKVKAPVEGAKQIPGAPLGTTNARQARALRERYLGTMETGAGGRDWYHDSGESLLFHANDDPERARLVTGDMAITSPTTSVSANTGFGIKGYNQAIAGVPIDTGRYPTAMGEAIETLHGGGEGSLGLKRDPFAQNIALGGGYQDPAADAAKRAVHDIWDAEAHGYVNPDGSPMRTGFGPAQHRFMDQQQDKILATANARGTGGFTNWDELRSQAAGWTGQQIDAGRLKPDEPAKSIADFLPEHYAQGSREFTPGETSYHMPEILDPENGEFRQLLHDVMRHDSGVYDEQGRDQIAAGFGGLVGPSFEGPGWFNGRASPGVQTQVLAGSERAAGGLPGEREVDEGSRRIMDAAEATHGLFFGQDASAWNQLLDAGSGGARTGWNVTLPFGTISPAEMEQLQRLLGPRGFVAVPTPTGVRLGLPAGAPTTQQALPFLREMDPTTKAAVKALGGKVEEASNFRSGYLENNWVDLPVGQGYYDAIFRMGPEAFDRFAPGQADRIRKSDAFFRRYTGGRFSLSPYLDEVRGTIANEGYAGLQRLATKYGLPVTLLAVGLGALAGQGPALQQEGPQL